MTTKRTGPTAPDSDADVPPARYDSPQARVAAAIERLGQLSRLLLWEASRNAREPRSLSPVQIQILVFLSGHAPELCRVGALARELMVTPATVSDSVSALERKGLVAKSPAADDRRSTVLELTATGRAAAASLSAWAAPLEEAVVEMEDAGELLAQLLALIAGLERRGVVSGTRMCPTCHHFVERGAEKAGAYCRLMDKPLSPSELRIDCAEHTPAPR